jgi:hypothetical protein
MPRNQLGRLRGARTDTAHVLVLRYDFRGTSLVTLHFCGERQVVDLTIDARNAGSLVDIFGRQHSRQQLIRSIMSGLNHTATDGCESARQTTSSTDRLFDLGKHPCAPKY